MIVSILSPSGQPTHCLPLPNILRKIKKGTYKHEVAKIRYYFQHLEWHPFNEAKKILPSFSPCGHFNKRIDPQQMVSFSHCLFLETQPLTQEGLDQARRIIETENTTLACFLNHTGDRLAIIIKYNGQLHHYHLIFQEVQAYLESTLHIPINPNLGHPYQTYPLSYDPLAYFNENATNFPLQRKIITLNPT